MNCISNVINDNNFIQISRFGLKNFYLKIEALNPAGSIKMKTALGLIDDLETKGKIQQDTILIESSSGSLGIAVSIICAERGYPFTCVVDPNTAAHNVKLMRAMGTKIVSVDTRDENGGYLGTRIKYIQNVLKTSRHHVWLNQYANPENPGIHARTTAASIAAAFKHIDYLFVAAGTTGTLMGCVQFFRRHRPEAKIVAVDSIGSVTFGFPPSKRFIPGLGTSRRPEIYSPEGIHAFEMVAEADAIAMCRYLARTAGLLAGGSTGTVLCAVRAWQKRLPANAVVVAISPDLGERYLDTIYDDAWVMERFGSAPLSGRLDEPTPILPMTKSA